MYGDAMIGPVETVVLQSEERRKASTSHVAQGWGSGRLDPGWTAPVKSSVGAGWSPPVKVSPKRGHQVRVHACVHVWVGVCVL